MMKRRDDRRAWRRSFRRLLRFTALAIAALAAVAEAPAAQEAQQAFELRPDGTVAREIAGGTSHAYTLALEPGRFLHLVVEQRGVDVGLTLFDPKGARLFEVDSPNGTSGPEPLFFVADAGGTYRLEIRALDQKAKAGLYEAKIEALRPATESDRKWMEAYRLFTEAEGWRLRQTLEARRDAALKYTEALRIWRKAGDHARAAQTLSALGWLYETLNEWTQALDAYDAALPLWRALGDRKAEADALSGIGWIYFRRGEQYRETKALPYFEQALVLQRAVGDSTGENLTLNRIGNIHLLLDRRQQALEFYTQALELSRRTGNAQAEATALGNLGWAYIRMGEPERAPALLDEALRLFRTHGNRRMELLTFTDIGHIYATMRDYRKALEQYEQALALSRVLGDRAEEARLHTRLAASYAEIGEPAPCLRHAEEALVTTRAITSLGGEANALHSVASCHALAGDVTKALELFKQSLTLKRAFGDRSSEHATLFRLARLEASRGEVEQARRYIEQALDIAESLRAETAGSALRVSFFSTVQEYYAFHIELLMRQHARDPRAGHDAEAFEVSERKRARSLLDALAGAGADLRQGVDPALLDREQKAQKDFNARAVELNKLSGAAPPDAAAIESAGRKLAEAHAELQTAEARVRSASPRYAALARPLPVSVKQTQTQLLDPDTALVEYALGPERSFAFVLTATTLDAYELPKASEIEEAAREVYAILTARYPAPKETPTAYARRVASADARYEAAAAKLSRMVLAPLAARLDRKRLLIVSDGALQYVPFAALPTVEAAGSRPLILKHEIVNLPSASALVALRRETWSRDEPLTEAVAVFADPVFDAGDVRVKRRAAVIETAAKISGAAPRENSMEGAAGNARSASDGASALRAAREAGDAAPDDSLRRLVFSREEATAIVSLAATSRRFVDFDASRAAATGSELPRFRYVHFATHSFVNNRLPELSGIVLSLVDERGHPQDGFLRLQDIYRMRLPAELVTLSACRTAVGREVRGEGLMSLTRGFMYAGARRVAASLWKVDDAATAELMEIFYRHLLTGPRAQRPTPADALRQAQLELMRRPNRRAPFYWAAFMLQGEWR